jgi:hypothetical protein
MTNAYLGLKEFMVSKEVSAVVRTELNITIDMMATNRGIRLLRDAGS